MDGGPMRLHDSAHTSRPWRIHELTRDFHLEDVWALPTPGGPQDFQLLVQTIASGDPAQGSSCAARALWRTRWRLGREAEGPARGGLHGGERAVPARDRPPADDAPPGAGMAGAARRGDAGARLALPAMSAGGRGSRQWVVVYDADCGLCTWLLAGLL